MSSLENNLLNFNQIQEFQLKLVEDLRHALVNNTRYVEQEAAKLRFAFRITWALKINIDWGSI